MNWIERKMRKNMWTSEKRLKYLNCATRSELAGETNRFAPGASVYREGE